MGEPLETLSPILILIAFTTPAEGEGISMVALSDSSVMSDCSFVTASPGFTSTSMTSTSLKSPMSGTSTWLMDAGSYGRRIRFLWVDAVLLYRLGDLLGLHLALVGERLQSGDGDEVAVYLEEVAQLGARIRAPETIGAEHPVGPPLRHERPDLLGEALHVVARRDHRPGALLEHLRYVGRARLRFRMQHVPAVGGKPVAAQLGEACRGPDVGGHAPVLLEEFRRGLHLAQDGARAEKLHARLVLRLRLAQAVHPLQDAFFGALRHGRMLVVLVHQGDVIEDILLIGDHAAQPVLDDHRDLVAVARIVGDAVRHYRGQEMRVAVLVLQALAVQRGAA